MNFEPTADVRDILKTLRDNKLAWIAEEIETTIGNGKLITKRYSEPGKKRIKTGTMTVAFDDNEQETILATTLKNYLIGVEKIWGKAQDKLSGVFEESSAKPSLVSPGSTAKQELFTSLYGQQDEKLDNLLNTLLPEVHENQTDDESAEDSL